VELSILLESFGDDPLGFPLGLVLIFVITAEAEPLISSGDFFEGTLYQIIVIDLAIRWSIWAWSSALLHR
jgi:hypothetical protein